MPLILQEFCKLLYISPHFSKLIHSFLHTSYATLAQDASQHAVARGGGPDAAASASSSLLFVVVVGFGGPA